MYGFQAQIVGAVAEGGGHCPILDLVMLVVRDTAAQAHGADPCHGVAPLAAQIVALALQAHHGHIAAFMVVIFMVAVAMVVPAAVQVQAMQVAAFQAMVVARQPVVCGLPRVGRAQIAAVISNPGETDTAIIATRAAACNLAAAFPTATDAVIVRIAGHALSMDGEIAAAAGHRHSACCTRTARARAHFDLALIALLRHAGGNLVVQHIDHTTDRTRAIDQRRWPSQYLDLPGQHGLRRHQMVGAHGRGVLNRRTALQHLDARTVHATDHRTARPCAKVGGLNARLP
ncbi:hypothetical protein D3C72_1445980 [compost metagenome]